MSTAYEIRMEPTPKKRAFTIYAFGEPIWTDTEEEDDFGWHARFMSCREIVARRRLATNSA